MKMLLVTYNEALDDEVMEVLHVSGVAGYTKWTRVLGDGRSSGPHLATPVWPKANNVLMAAVEDAQVPPLIECLKALRADLSKEGVKAFVMPLEAVT